MTEQRGRHFDPDLLDIFIGAYDVFCGLSRRHPEESATAAADTARNSG
jgi:response regulator RpfG family c-di-GMP phosphodiesterase